MVLLLLAIMWAAVLGPTLVRNRVDSRSQDSIGDFRRQLGVLQRTGPNLVTPANSLRTRAPIGSRIPVDSRSTGEVAPVTRASATGYGSVTSAHRRKMQQRRRDVLMLLVGTLLGTLVLGAVPRLHVLWIVSAVTAFALMSYVALLVRLRNIVAEREMKLTYLPRPGAPQPALLRRSAN